MDIIKKIAAIILILVAALCLGGAALAEETPGVTPEDFMGEWVDLDGTCNIDITEHTDGEIIDGYVVNVHMPVIAEESYSYVTWAYGCVWDDETQTLKSISRVTGKGDYEPDSEEEITDANLDYTAAAFSFDEEGRLAWNDENETADDGLLFVRPIGWGEAYMPAEAAAFEGVWQCDRATIAMDWEEEGFKALITWGSSAWEHTEWEYTCFYHDEDNTLVSMPFGTRTEVVYDENGEQASATEVYNDGNAVFSLDEEGKLIWLDEKENAGEGMRFEKLPEKPAVLSFATIGEAMASEGFTGVIGGDDQHYVVAVEKDGDYIRVVADLDDEARRLREATLEYVDAEKLEAAFHAYDKYVRTLPIAYEEKITAQPKILAVYSSPEAQIITNDDQSKALADTVIFLYQDHSYVQYVDHESRYEVYTKGTFEANFDWTEPGWQDKMPHILTIHAEQLHTAEHQLKSADLAFDVNLDRSMEYCLYPDNTNPDQQLAAAFMQVDKQKLVRTDGSEAYLPTLWFYYDDGTFRQFAVMEGNENVLFSCGSYTVTDGMFTDESVLTIHRTQKYQDGVGLADYDSTHDYRIGDLDFIRVYPKADSGFWSSEITDGIFERIQGKSFKEDCTLPREDLRYLHVLHVGLDGETHEGEMIVNYHIAQDVLDIFQQLYEAKYPIEKIRLVDEYDADDELSMEDNNSSSFNFRFISHTTRVSKHGLGLAVDINTLYNPYTKVVDGVRIVEPITGEPYLDREADFPCKIDHDDLCYRLFIEHGFEWGGDWEDRKDYQHFEIPTNVIAEWYPENEE